MSNQPTTEEQEIHKTISDVYNSGRCGEAVAMAVDFIARYPNSYLARYSYAVMHGDYSYSQDHDPQEKQRLSEIAKRGLIDLIDDPEFDQWPEKFQRSVRNEYYWFFEMHEEQYMLGIEGLGKGQGGHYSACVGASMLAYKRLGESQIDEAEKWANTSLEHFREFEKVAPHWYNINYFAAQALACLGEYEQALNCFKDMYRKQRGDVRRVVEN